MTLKNKKGFTLIELLAVIVILAIIIIIAMPSVLNSMEKARKRAFVIESNTAIRSAQSAYAESTTAGDNWCISIEDLIDGGHYTKANTGYKGKVTIEFNSANPYKAIVTVWLTNGTFHIIGQTADQTGADNAAETIIKSGAGEWQSDFATCS